MRQRRPAVPADVRTSREPPRAEDLTSEVFNTALPPMRLPTSKGQMRAYLRTAASDAPIRAGKVLRGLPERYRRILELRFLGASSIKEAAPAMDISVSNAKVLQHRVLRMAATIVMECEQ